MEDDTPVIEPHRTALLVMDYQEGIVASLEDAAAALAQMRAAIEVARTHGLTVGYVRVAFDDADRVAVPDRNKSFTRLVAGTLAMAVDAPETTIPHAVAPRDGDIVVCKKRVGPFSTTDLSQGQRKRLALLTAYLEDRPIYLFDEWAADQDPVFKKVFYTQLLPELKARGKAVLVISHDERYFGMADRVLRLDYGKLAPEPSGHVAAASA